MLYIALAETVVIALLMGGFLLRERDHDAMHLERELNWRAERQELLSRIQHPQVYVPPVKPASPPPTVAYTDMDEFERVGKILLGDPEDDQ